jgi:hypothetical protein
MHIAVEDFAISLKAPPRIFAATEVVRFETIWMCAPNSGSSLTTKGALDVFPSIDSLDYILPFPIRDLHFRSVLSAVVVSEYLSRSALESKKRSLSRPASVKVTEATLQSHTGVSLAKDC